VGESKPSRREETALATRGLLLAAARECFGERGYAAAGIEAIAARAGVTTGALYHHFGNKRGLFRAVVEAMEAELMRWAIEIGSRHADPWQGLEAAMRATLDASLAPDVRQIVLLDAPNVLGAAEWREIEDQYSMGLLRTAVAGMMGAGLLAPGSPELVARTLVAVVGALASSIAHAPDPPAARRDAEALLGRVLGALRAEPARG
jgi:AcrR family transcriptional regulator